MYIFPPKSNGKNTRTISGLYRNPDTRAFSRQAREVRRLGCRLRDQHLFAPTTIPALPP